MFNWELYEQCKKYTAKDWFEILEGCDTDVLCREEFAAWMDLYESQEE